MEINAARLYAGLSTEEALALLDISPRTWARWKSTDTAPAWAHHLLEQRAGHLDNLGWRDWQIRGGTLYCNQLHHSHHWKPGDLLAGLVAPRL